MAVFTFSKEAIQRAQRRSARVRTWLIVVSISWLVVDVLEATGVMNGIGLQVHLTGQWANAAFTVPMLLLFQGLRAPEKDSKPLVDFLHNYSCDVSPYGVRVQSDLFPQKRLSREEIDRMEEPSLGGGLYLRTTNRYRWIVIPRRIGGYNELKELLATDGVPLVKKIVPGNWEWFVLISIACGSILCTLMAHDRRILMSNFLVAFLVGIAGILMINANPDNLPVMRWTRFGYFLPAIFALLVLCL